MAAERESMTMRNLQLVAPGAGTRTFPGEVAALPIILHVDKPGFRRDCIGEQLAAHLPEWRIEAVSSVRDCPPDMSWASGSLVIISLPEASIGTAEFAADIALIAHAVPGMPVVIMCDSEDVSTVRSAIGAGTRGYLPSSLPIADVIGAIRLVSAGGTYVPASVLIPLLKDQGRRPERLERGQAERPEFSPRELDVLARLRQGKQNKVIAYELGIAVPTVKVHVQRIMKKLNARNRTQVVLMTGDIISRTARERCSV